MSRTPWIWILVALTPAAIMIPVAGWQTAPTLPTKLLTAAVGLIVVALPLGMIALTVRQNRAKVARYEAGFRSVAANAGLTVVEGVASLPGFELRGTYGDADVRAFVIPRYRGRASRIVGVSAQATVTLPVRTPYRVVAGVGKPAADLAYSYGIGRIGNNSWFRVYGDSPAAVAAVLDPRTQAAIERSGVAVFGYDGGVIQLISQMDKRAPYPAVASALGLARELAGAPVVTAPNPAAMPARRGPSSTLDSYGFPLKKQRSAALRRFYWQMGAIVGLFVLVMGQGLVRAVIQSGRQGVDWRAVAGGGSVFGLIAIVVVLLYVPYWIMRHHRVPAIVVQLRSLADKRGLSFPSDWGPYQGNEMHGLVDGVPVTIHPIRLNPRDMTYGVYSVVIANAARLSARQVAVRPRGSSRPRGLHRFRTDDPDFDRCYTVFARSADDVPAVLGSAARHALVKAAVASFDVEFGAIRVTTRKEYRPPYDATEVAYEVVAAVVRPGG